MSKKKNINNNIEDKEAKSLSLEKQDETENEIKEAVTAEPETAEPVTDETEEAVPEETVETAEKSTDSEDEKEKKPKDDKKSEKKTEKKADKKSEKKPDKKDDQKSKKKAARKDARKAKRELKARAFRRGWFSIVLVVLFIAAIVLINFIAVTLTEKVPAFSLDTTGKNSFALSKETLEYLPGLKDDIRIIVLSDEEEYKSGGEYYIQTNTLLHEYDNNSDKITLEYVDMASNPTFSSKYPNETLSYYGVIVECDKGYKYLKDSDLFNYEIDYNTYNYVISDSKVEEAVTSAILNVTLDNKPKVTFISDINGEDYSYFKNYLETNGFETDEMSPAVGSIPEDTSILVLFAPSVDLDENAVNSISDFLLNDGEYGKEFLYLPSAALLDTPNIDSLIEEWGIKVDNGYAIENDTDYMAPLGGGYYLFATQYAEQTYNAKMKNKNLPFCVIGGYTKPLNIVDTTNVTSLLTLSDQSTVIYADESADEPVASPNLVIGAIAEKGTTTADDTDSSETETKQSHIIVIGSSVAMSETLLKSNVYGNSTYILSAFNTLVNRDDVSVSIEAKSLSNPDLGITSAKIRILGTLFIIIIPLGILIAGFVIFIKRLNM